MPPGARRRLLATLQGPLADALRDLPPDERRVLRQRLRDCLMDQGAARYVEVERLAADVLLALVGDLDAPDHVADALTVVVRTLMAVLADCPAPGAFAPLGPLLAARPVDAPAVRAWLAHAVARCEVRPAYRSAE